MAKWKRQLTQSEPRAISYLPGFASLEIKKTWSIFYPNQKLLLREHAELRFLSSPQPWKLKAYFKNIYLKIFPNQMLPVDMASRKIMKAGKTNTVCRSDQNWGPWKTYWIQWGLSLARMKSKADFPSFGSTFSKAEHGQLKYFIDLRKLFGLIES